MKKANRKSRIDTQRPSGLLRAYAKTALVYHDGSAFGLAQELRNFGLVVDERPLFAAAPSEPQQLAVLAAQPGKVRTRRLSALLRDLCINGQPVLAVGTAMHGVAQLFGGHANVVESSVARLANLETLPEALFAGVESQMRIAVPEGVPLHVEQVGPELRVTARTRDGEVIGLSHVYRPIHGVHTAALESPALRKVVCANVLRLMRERNGRAYPSHRH